MSPQIAFYLAWLLFAVSWIGGAFWAGRAVARPGFIREIPYRLISLAGFVLLFDVYDPPFFPVRPLWRLDRSWAWVLVIVTIAGFAFCWWARVHLGRLWSGWVTTKEDHHIVDTGPYRYVRHPIYTGLLLAAGATAIATGTLTAIVGAIVLGAGYWLKAKLEEQFLHKQLGSEYDSYRRKVAMLVPFGPK
jgi:protein-S-isoprenylcysteine O-methyltransferase Ste14